ncbi:MAG TPA: glycosyltransferase, partial [Nitrospirae bacterium]|nr:glycosyltransferase [Nitrospirota bacterium]
MDDQGDIEGFGISLVEANAYGKPVIVGNSGGVGNAV